MGPMFGVGSHREADDLAAQENANREEAVWHYVIMEVWPPLTPGDYPMQLPEHHTAMTRSPQEFETAVQANLPAGWTGNITSHNRFKCVPSHSGRN
jgi:hypothetical protein